MKHVLVVAGHSTFREALSHLLVWDDFEESSQADSLEQGRRQVGMLDDLIDVAVVDLDLADEEAIELIGEIREAEPNVPILVLTSASEIELHDLLRRMGVQEVLTKATSAEQIVGAIRHLGST
jgi:DNA-binding NarL/FixJ family response regulator